MDDNEDEQTISLPPKKRLKQHDRRQPNHEGSSSEIHSCNVCQKSFASLKALNGHMKIHGGSKSKAARPPFPAPEPSEDNDNDNDNDGVSASSSSDTNIKKDVDVASFLQNLSDIEIQRNGPNGPREEGYCWKQCSRDYNAEDRLGYGISGKKTMPVPYKDNPSSKKVKIDGTTRTGSALVQKKLAGGKRKASVEDDEKGDQSRVPKDFTSNISKKVKIVGRGEDPKRDMVSHDQTRKLQIPRKPQVESSKTFPASQAMETYSWNCKSSRSASASVKIGESGFGTKYAAKSSTSLKMGESGFGAKYGTKSNTNVKMGHSGYGTKYAKSTTSVKVGESGFGTKLAARAPTSTKEAAKEDNKQHVCEICHRTFKTYQGLGGHRRIHNSRGGVAKEAPTAPEVRAATGHEDGETGVDPQGHRSVGSSRRVSVRKAPAAPVVRAPSDHEDGGSDEDPEAALHEEEAGAKTEGRHERGFNLNQVPDEDSDGAA